MDEGQSNMSRSGSTAPTNEAKLMRREDLRVGMEVAVRLPSGRRGDENDVAVAATVTRPLTQSALVDCVDVRLGNGEHRTVHVARIESRNE